VQSALQTSELAAGRTPAPKPLPWQAPPCVCLLPNGEKSLGGNGTREADVEPNLDKREAIYRARDCGIAEKY